MPRHGKYPDEMRQRAVRMVLEHQAEHGSQWEAICAVAEKLGPTLETVRKWVRQAERDQGLRAGPTTEELAEIKRLKREVAELRRANDMAGSTGERNGVGGSSISLARSAALPRWSGSLMVRTHRHLDAAPFDWEPRPGCLTIEDREQILIGIHDGKSLTSIAEELDYAPSTVCREVKANGGRDQYSAWKAHRRARDQARRPKSFKLRAGRLLEEVTRRLRELWSPDEISNRLKIDYPDDPEMRVSHETIYQSLFVQGRGELRRELARCLRTGRTSRKPRGLRDGRGRLPGMVNIAERPAEAEDRASLS